jgi:hypothetical protein
VTLYDILSLKNDVNVPSKSNKQKTQKKLFFVSVFKFTVRGKDPRIRIRTEMSRIRNNGKKMTKNELTHLAGGGEDRVEAPVCGDVEHLPRLVVGGEGDTLQQRLQPLLTLQQKLPLECGVKLGAKWK